MLDMMKSFFVVHAPMPSLPPEPSAAADRRAEVMQEAWRRATTGAELIEFYRSVGLDWVVSAD